MNYCVFWWMLILNVSKMLKYIFDQCYFDFFIDWVENYQCKFYNYKKRESNIFFINKLKCINSGNKIRFIF